MDKRLNFIFSRHSVRQFTPEPVAPELIDELLQSAMAAPSARRGDPWRFIVLESRKRREEVAAVLEYGRFIADAPLGILVCGSLPDACGGELSYLLQDCGAAIENLLLAANALGLGACWLGVHPRPERIEPLTRMFALPSGIIPVSAIAIGHPAEHRDASSRFDADKVFAENWGEPYGA